MISIQKLIDKANERISQGGLTELQIIQLSTLDTAEANSKVLVATTNDLPSAANNKGRMMYVEAEDSFYFSNGTTWTNNFSTELTSLTDTAYAWGRNVTNSTLGDGTSLNRSSPVTVVGGITNWLQLSGGYRFSLGVTSTGIAYAWGAGSYGATGTGATSTTSSPVTVVGSITNWSNLSAGQFHSLGLIDTGTLYAWGRNNQGALGTNNVVSTSSPVTVVGGITGWTDISGGAGFSLGIANGIAYAWGYNSSGRLGDGTTTTRSSPVTVVGGITNWSQISAGRAHSLGIANRVAYAWGLNSYGRLGNGTTTSAISPVVVVGGILNWKQVSAAKEHSLGLTNSGILYAWGINGSGRLGTNNLVNSSSPVTVVGGITNWAQISTAESSEFSTALTNNGLVYSWGVNTQGQLGDGTTISKSSPVTVVGGIDTWAQVAAGAEHNLVIANRVQEGFK